MKQITHISYNGDTYEITLHGFIIARISCYWGGSPMRQDVQYDDLPKVMQEKILDKITELLINENE